MKNPLILAIDFDGTIVKWEEDHIPRELLPFAREIISWASKFCYIIIWTSRPETDFPVVRKFLKEHGIPFNLINQNAPFTDFETGRKIFADAYLDDLGISNYLDINWLKMQELILQVLVTKAIQSVVKSRKNGN